MNETKRIIGRPKVSSEYATQYWKDMDDQFKKTIQRTNTTFLANLIINFIVIALGVILMAYSIIYSWKNGLDIYSVGFGTIGVVAFITTFFFTTQKNVQKAAINSAQMQILYKAFNTVWENVSDQLSDPDRQLSLEQMKELNTHLANVAKDLASVMKDTAE
jgi:hypothetical protein